MTISDIFFRIEADHSRFTDVHIRINNGAPKAAIAADLGVRQQYGPLHLTVAMHTHTGRKHAVNHTAARDDATR